MKVNSAFSVTASHQAVCEESPLIKAVNGGDLQELQRLLKSGMGKIDAADENGDTAFMHAARFNRLEMMQLLSPGNYLGYNQRNAAGETAMMQAAKSKSLEAMGWLIASGADVNIMDNSGSTAFLEYIGSLDSKEVPSEKLVREFLGAHIYFDAVDSDGRNALMLMAKTRGPAKYYFLQAMSAQGHLNATDKNGCTALYLATEGGLYDFAMQLVAFGAMIDTAASDGRAAQDVARDAGKYPFAEYLKKCEDSKKSAAMKAAIWQGIAAVPAWNEHYRSLDSSAVDDADDDPNRRVNFDEMKKQLVFSRAIYEEDYYELESTPLLDAVKSGDREKISRLVADGFLDFDFKDGDGWNSLMHAAISIEEDFLEFFLDEVEGADIEFDLNSVNDLGESALILVSRRVREEHMKLLLEREVDVNVIDHFGRNAFMVYLRNCRGEVDAEVVQSFLDAGVDLYCRDRNYQMATALFSGKVGREAKEIFLRSEGILLGIDNVDSYRRTALMHAVEKRDFELFELLIDAGAKLDIEVEGVSARSLAQQLGFDEFLTLINRRNGSYENSSDSDGDTASMNDAE